MSHEQTDLPVLDELGDSLFAAFAAAERERPRTRWHLRLTRRLVIIASAVVLIAPAAYATHIFNPSGNPNAIPKHAHPLVSFRVGSSTWSLVLTKNAKNSCYAQVIVPLLDGAPQVTQCVTEARAPDAGWTTSWTQNATAAFEIGFATTRVTRVDVVDRPATVERIPGTPVEFFVYQAPLSWFGDAPTVGYDAHGHVVFTAYGLVHGGEHYELFKRLLAERAHH